MSYDNEFYAHQVTGGLASARVLLRALFDDFSPIDSVIDVGCGVAPWLRTALDLGATHGLGLDGNYVDRSRLLIDPARFRPCDLETENLHNALLDSPPFDLAVCVEVAGHLSPARAAPFIAELCSLSDLILFSAAIPDQGGTNQINGQWPDYWSTLFTKAGFDCFDILRSRFWQRGDCEWWYLQNVLVFARRDSAPFQRAMGSGPSTVAPMRLVHPRNLYQAVEGLRQRVAELEELVRYQPFGRDEGIRALEAKVDFLRDRALTKDNEIEAATADLDRLRAELTTANLQSDTLRREIDAIHASTAWRITAPLRRLKVRIRRCAGEGRQSKE